ncbi:MULTISPECIES: DegT/DnrJ/EryC1/StrS family aminotransferase [Aequorivita]|uniref:DegT/DnrJ/EryC1/StrS family aminotransferase n=1 Tax=Aequorivita iocasae TaxID=2803865 RepID=A0ABX7DS25_9FLAO|nr:MULTISPECIES: DegT/DnrJ/EryC1/StrS family aminotransferase [Aequorivita]QQX76803.1 DegT/DnrJ/EryC1/StrS family aminotransferase [Aequorivita iocasae]UCA56275.1 DegT/DnrJ/EryC1/StrS family aminotransferase [Aequorivita sp. F7]
MINVTKTFLPPQEEYNAILKRAWDIGWITNRGILVKELEESLKEYLKVPNIIATTNGTLPLQIAIKAMGLSDEIITTPFSYVATTSSIVWEGCIPVFVDIHPEYLTIDETKIETAITSKTTGILATHVFGNPCAVEEIEAIAKKHNLKVIYDAAHCFGVTYKGKSIFEYGDVSTCSFHATKLFHTGEGGALFTQDEMLHQKMFYHHNFGHKGKEDFQGLGINAKMSEMQAAMGLTILPYIDEIKKDRERVVSVYLEQFKELQQLKIREETQWNFSYFPVIFEDEEILLKVQKALLENDIVPRRYFYPSLESLPYLKKTNLKVSRNIASQILCLPLYSGLKQSSIELIVKTIKNAKG